MKIYFTVWLEKQKKMKLFKSFISFCIFFWNFDFFDFITELKPSQKKFILDS